MQTEANLTTSIKRWIAFFIVSIIISGVTAFPLQSELELLMNYTHLMPASIAKFVTEVTRAIVIINKHFPFLAYGTDWLAFAHIVIAIAFYGPYQNPVRNVWVVEWGMICCVLIFPLAFICGSIRHIPFCWQLVDCSFGLIGIIPLLHVRKQIKKLEQLNTNLI